MVELGKYAGAVLSAYGISLFLLGVIVALTWWRGRKVRAALRDFEERRGGGNG